MYPARHKIMNLRLQLPDVGGRLSGLALVIEAGQNLSAMDGNGDVIEITRVNLVPLIMSMSRKMLKKF